MTQRNISSIVFFAGLFFWMVGANGMEFELRPVPNTSPPRSELVMSGTVRGTELSELKEWLDQNPEIDTILLKDSGGGNAAAGYAVGEFIREKGLTTGLIGRCASSCSRMFLGGRKRFFSDEMPSNKTMIGFHGNYGRDGQLEKDRVEYLKAWVIKHLDWDDAHRRQYEPLVDQWVNIGTNAGMIYFFDETKFKTSDGASVIFCSGAEPRPIQLKNCERKHGVTARGIGLLN